MIDLARAGWRRALRGSQRRWSVRASGLLWASRLQGWRHVRAPGTPHAFLLHPTQARTSLTSSIVAGPSPVDATRGQQQTGSLASNLISEAVHW